MMKHVFLLAFVLITHIATGQKYFSKTGLVTFSSSTPMEKIEARNTTAGTVIDIGTGQMEWGVLIRGFQFDKAMMQEHFNENYMESHTYPKAKFKGKIDNLADVQFTKNGEYKVTVTGQLEIHGVTRPVTTQGTISVHNGQIAAKSKFSVLVADYGIEIPKVVADNIAKSVEIQVEAQYQIMNTAP
jgi:hypothetical protein